MITEQHGSNSGHRPALSVDQFCAKYGVCRASFYNLLKAGRGPKVMKLGSRTLISAEADEAWRAERESATLDVA
jgi:predicted DNA-binding transcriptional regulator AlpA